MSRDDWSEMDFYGVLGVSHDASAAQIRRAFRALVKRNHPDSNHHATGDPAGFIAVSEAYDVLSDESSRADYDATIFDTASAHGTSGDFLRPRRDEVGDPVDLRAEGGRTGARGDVDVEGWYQDPFGHHDLRWFSAGLPTDLVRDGRDTARDEPPAGAPFAAPIPADQPYLVNETLRVDDWSGADDGSTSPRLSRTRWPGSVPPRSGWARALFAAITVAFAVFALPHSRYFAHAAPAGASSGVTPRLQIDDLAFTLPAGRACSLEPVRWRIVGYTGGSYTIEWTVTHEQGRPWSWEPMTEHPGPQGELEVPICPSVVGDARSRFLVTGVLTPVTTPGAVGDGASLATAHISVDVRG